MVLSRWKPVRWYYWVPDSIDDRYCWRFIQPNGTADRRCYQKDPLVTTEAGFCFSLICNFRYTAGKQWPHMRKYFLLLNSLLLLAATPVSFAQNKKPSVAQLPMKLWYNKASTAFEEALVLGNGQMGATVYGGAATDLIHLNDITLWSGEPVDPYMNRNAYQHLPTVREALQRNDYAAADTLVKKLQGKFSESYAPLGNLYLDFPAGDVV